jgi:hypothetical protein
MNDGPRSFFARSLLHQCLQSRVGNRGTGFSYRLPNDAGNHNLPNRRAAGVARAAAARNDDRHREHREGQTQNPRRNPCETSHASSNTARWTPNASGVTTGSEPSPHRVPRNHLGGDGCRGRRLDAVESRGARLGVRVRFVAQPPYRRVMRREVHVANLRVGEGLDRPALYPACCCATGTRGAVSSEGREPRASDDEGTGDGEGRLDGARARAYTCRRPRRQDHGDHSQALRGTTSTSFRTRE